MIQQELNNISTYVVGDFIIKVIDAHNVRYQYCPLFPIDEQELEKFVIDRLPTLKGKDFKILF